MRTGDKAWIADGVICLGIVGSLGMIAVTAVLNYRFGYRLGGSDEVERQLYGWGFGFADVVKALMPFTLAVAIRKRDWIAGVGSAAFFAVATISSFYAGIGLAAVHRSANEGTNTGIIDKRNDLKAEKQRLEARLAVIGNLDGVAAIERTIDAAFANPVAPGDKTLGVYSERCRKSMVRTRDLCAKVARMNVELEQAREAETARTRLKDIQAEIGGLDSTVRSADPQLDVLETVSGWASLAVGRDDIRTGLLLCLGLLLELGSGLGLYAVTTSWRHREPVPEGRGKMTTVGDPAVYADERLVAARGGRITANRLFADYEAWCR
ncbi:MAG TPA: hypothetical protein VEA77_07215, partial [Hyphomicrobium sp.]|nr:hypothetical protein [Hyphomicrobium sp.]